MQTFSLSGYVTDQGAGVVAATDLGIFQVWLPGDRLPDLVGQHASQLSDKAARQLEDYFNGVVQQFDLPVDLSRLTPFRRHVLQLTMQIPYGKVITYGELAVQAGSPGAARAVGGALAANPVPVVIPCHRIVAASGSLTGYSGAGGILMKKDLLIMEGVDFRNIKNV